MNESTHEQEPVRHALERQDQLAGIIDALPLSEGHFEFEDWDISYNMTNPADETCNEKTPGEWMETPSLNLTGGDGRISLSIWVYGGVPEKFKKIILYHEVTEGLLALKYLKNPSEAHQDAQRHHEEYARSHLTREEMEQFSKWNAHLDRSAS